MLKTFTYKLIGSVLAFLVLTGLSMYVINRIVFADSCERTYGGGRECDRGLRIEKVVRIGDTGDYSESVNVQRGQIVTFKITIRNTGDVDINDIDFRDILPDEFELIDGDLIQEFERLDNGDDVKIVVYIKAKIKNSQFEAGVAKCVVNVAEVKADVNDNGNKEGYRDSASVCFGQAAKELPKTGPEDTIAMTLLGLTMSGSGLIIKKKYVK